MRRRPRSRPLAARGRRTIVAILLTFALFSVLSVALSIRATTGSQHRASVVEVAARQRTLAERYVNDVLLARGGAQVDPARPPRRCSRAAPMPCSTAAPPRPVNGDDDETQLPAATGSTVRAQLASSAGWSMT